MQRTRFDFDVITGPSSRPTPRTQEAEQERAGRCPEPRPPAPRGTKAPAALGTPGLAAFSSPGEDQETDHHRE